MYAKVGKKRYLKLHDGHQTTNKGKTHFFQKHLKLIHHSVLMSCLDIAYNELKSPWLKVVKVWLEEVSLASYCLKKS